MGAPQRETKTMTNEKLATYRLNRDQSAKVHQQISSHCEALKNWMASAVEAGEQDRAKELVRELRQYQDLFAMFNPIAFDRHQ